MFDLIVYCKELFLVLLFGFDKCVYEKMCGCLDMVIYVVVRLKELCVLFVFIFCDIYVQIVGCDVNKDGVDDYDKFVYVYVFGGENMFINMVEKFLDVDVGYYVMINFDGIKKVVDVFGGVKLLIEEDIVNKDLNYV